LDCCQIGCDNTGLPASTPSYPSIPLPRTHPHGLGGLALLHGLLPPERSRILDIGCGAGRNLCWIAATAEPESAIGIDIDGEAIQSARDFAQMLEVHDSVDFRHEDFRTLSGGPFDFIIVNGLYSWVPPSVRKELVAFLDSHLNPDGIAFVSFHEYRDRPWRHSLLRIADPVERLAAARAEWSQEFADIEDDGLLLQDALAEISDPVSELEFQDSLKGTNLEILCDAKLDQAAPDFHEAVLIRSRRESGDHADRIWWVTPESYPTTFQCPDPPAEVVEALSHPRPLTIRPGPCPIAWKPAILQVEPHICSYTGTLVDLSDPADRDLLHSLNGATPASGDTIDFFARAGLLIRAEAAATLPEE
jgi:SAM-dependent methyltransferase